MVDLYHLVKPALWALTPERAHGLALAALRVGAGALFPPPPPNPRLAVSLWSRDFANPVGLAAGFDKDAAAVRPLFRLGFGWIEVGGVTRYPQPGNPRPRLFRLDADRAVINRMGLNSSGLDAVRARLARIRRGGLPGPLFVNLGLNKDSPDPPADYAVLAEVLAPLADGLTINVSSPNTPGLRALQSPDRLIGILRAVAGALDAVSNRPALLLKIAPDLTAEDKAAIAEVALGERLDGLVVANTTVERPDSLIAPQRMEAGGLSGRPLFEPSTALLSEMYRLTGGRLPLVGVGGIASGADAYAKIRAGASLVQFYSALVYEGPALVRRILTELGDLLAADGYTSVADAVGADCR